jgi:hypothetical protein
VTSSARAPQVYIQGFTLPQYSATVPAATGTASHRRCLPIP